MTDLVHEVDWDAFTSLETAQNALNELLHGDFELDTPVNVMGQPALLFAASMYDEELALMILSQKHRIPVDINAIDSHSFSALHFAADADMGDLVKNLLEHEEIILNGVTDDLSILGHVESGGRTPLHLAALRGNADIVEQFLHRDLSLAMIKDWDGNSPLQLAQLHNRTNVNDKFFHHKFDIQTIAAEDVKKKRQVQQESAFARYQANLVTPEEFNDPHILPSIWSLEECNHVLDALMAKASNVGWQTKRHAAYPTTDLPSYCIPILDRWIHQTLRERLFPAIKSVYNLLDTTEISFRDLFFVKYEAAGLNVQNGLGLHCDGSVLSFNILLNPATSFRGGGTYFEPTNTTIKIEQGHAVVHSGRVVHGAAPVIEGKRLILVGFLNVRHISFST